MPTAIQFLRSSTQNLRPTPTDLTDGMPMVQLNETDPGLFFKLRDNSLCKVGPCSVGDNAPNSNPVLQTGNTIGETWLDTSTAGSEEFKVWDGTAWITPTSNVDAADLEFNGDVIPDTNDAYAIGSNAFRVSDLFVVDISATGNISVSGTVSVGSNVEVTGNITSAANDTSSIGTAAERFSDLFVVDISASGSQNLSGALNIGGNIVPSVNDSSSLGTNARRFSDLFAVDISATGSMALSTNLTVGGVIQANSLTNAANDAAAAAAGVGLNQFYRNGSVVQIRVV